MKLERDTAYELMALADGELEGEAKARAEKRVETDAHARQAALQMGDERPTAWLRESMENHATRAGADDVADQVLARIAASTRGGGRLAVLGFRGTWSRVQSAVGATMTVGLAAGIALYLALRPSAPTDGPSARDGRQGVPVSQLAAAAGTGGVEVDEIDAPAHDISLFEISGAGGALAANPSPPSSVVIWIEDEPGAQ